MWHFVDPLKCHVLFEWNQMRNLDWYTFKSKMDGLQRVGLGVECVSLEKKLEMKREKGYADGFRVYSGNGT